MKYPLYLLPLYLLPLAFATTLASCDDDEPLVSGDTQNLVVDFTGTVGADALALESSTYQAPGVAEGYRLSRMSFFVSEVELITDTPNGELGTDVAEIGYVELDPTGAGSLPLTNVPDGDYVGIRFNLGLTEEQDAQTPADFAADHPLAQTNEYWVDWGSYIFLKVEGRSDTLADGNARFDQSFVYHVGKAAEFTRRLEIRTPITINGTSERVSVGVDIESLLGLRGAEPLSLTGVADHQNTAAARIMDNAGRAFTRRN